MAVVKFKRPDKAPSDPLEVTDPLPEHINSTARLVYLRIINEREKGVLLQADRIAVELAAQTTAEALAGGGGFCAEHRGDLRGAAIA